MDGGLNLRRGINLRNGCGPILSMLSSSRCGGLHLRGCPLIIIESLDLRGGLYVMKISSVHRMQPIIYRVRPLDLSQQLLRILYFLWHYVKVLNRNLMRMGQIIDKKSIRRLPQGSGCFLSHSISSSLLLMLQIDVLLAKTIIFTWLAQS